MAPYSNYISFLFLTTLLLPLQITARDSQFFSKVTHFNDNNNVKESEIPNKEGQEINKAEQQEVFIPETENSYGLYGHDSNEPPSTTTTTTTNSYHPYKPQFEDTSKYPNNNNKYYNNDAYNNNNKYYNKDAYEGNQYELSDTKYTEEGYYNNNRHNKYYYNNNAANDRYHYNNNNNYNVNNNNKYSYNTNAANYRFNGEKQGMSDTRFLEGGRYFHDINAEKEYNPTSLYGDSSRGVNTNLNGPKNGGNNHNGYQNQAEFEFEQDEFQP